MCTQGKCLYCIPIKIACFVLAIINAVANGLVLICCCIMLVMQIFFGGGGFGIKVGGVRFKRDVSETEEGFWLPLEYWLPMLTLSSLLSLICSIILCIGISNRRWKHVKLYFDYGSVVTVLWALASVIQLCTNHPAEYGLWGLFICVLHACFLVLVHKTYRQLLEDSGVADHIRLDDVGDMDTTSLI